MQLKDITPNTNYNDFANKVIDFGVMGKYKITQRFNDKDTIPSLLATYKSWGLVGHNGLDLVSCNANNQILSPVDGKVVFADWYTNLAWVEKGIFHGGGIMTFIQDKDNYLHCFLHLSENQNLNVGNLVKKGQSIGTQGGSGTKQNEFANHCHYYLCKVDNDLDIQNQGNGFFGGLDPLEFIKNNVMTAQTSQFHIQTEEQLNNWVNQHALARIRETGGRDYLAEIDKLQEANAGLARQNTDASNDRLRLLDDKSKAEDLTRQTAGLESII